MIKHINNNSGLSIVATILTLLMFSLFIAVAVSLVTTGAHIGVQEEQGDQAFYIADGGIQYVLAFAQDTNTIPNYSTHDTWINLGNGTFKVDTLTYLESAVAVSATPTTISVHSTDSFPATGRIKIDDEFIQYTSKDDVADTFTVTAVTSAHSQYNSVYPATQLNMTISAADCNNVDPIDVDDDTGGFDISKPFFIDNEYFLCASRETQLRLRNCQRCLYGSQKAAHTTNSYASQYILTSTGMITNFLSNNVQRVVQISAGPHEE